jgi:amino acid transporter
VTEEDRRFANNPFARALHPAGKRTALQWVALVLVSVVGFVIMAAAFILPLLFAHGLLTGAHGRWSMLAAGILVAAIYALMVVRLVRRRRRG